MSPPFEILLADDDIRLIGFLADRLRRDGFQVRVATTGAEAIAAVDEQWPDLTVLDLMLPDMSGEQVADEIKKRADLPIVVLSAVSEVSSKTVLLQRFAEDYLTKPFHYSELRARIDRVLLRLQDRLPVQEIDVGPGLRLVLRRREAVVDGRPVHLTPTETRLLATLAADNGKPVSTERLLARVWPGADGADPVYVWVTVRRLRQKLEPDPGAPRYLHTERRGGYRLGAETPSAPG